MFGVENILEVGNLSIDLKKMKVLVEKKIPKNMGLER